MLLSTWYTRKELALRTAILYSGLVLATAFSGVIAAGIFAGLSGVHGLHGWQWLFIVEGAGSAFAALVAMVLLPDFPDSKRFWTGSNWWLYSSEELSFAKQRIDLDRVSLPSAERTLRHGLILAVKDIRTWIFVSFYHPCFTIFATEKSANKHQGAYSVRKPYSLWV